MHLARRIRSWSLCLTAFSLYTASLNADPTVITVGLAGDNHVPLGMFGAPGATDLRGALNHVNSVPLSNGYLINFTVTSPITLQAMLPLLNLVQPYDLAIDGGTGITIDGASQFRGFFANKGNITLSNLQIQNVKAQGGAGGNDAGGGGMGAGAGLFVRGGATVNISNVKILQASVIGGNGGPAGSGNGGGGGGMGGNGGDRAVASNTFGGGGGGGLGGNGGNGQSTFPTCGGGGGGINCGSPNTGQGAMAPATIGTGTAGTTGGGIGGASGGSGENIGTSPGGASGGGGGASLENTPSAGGGGGVGGGAPDSLNAGSGGDGGGGGGGNATFHSGGIGGYGGGSGGGLEAATAGFGGGLGRGSSSMTTAPGFGGGGNGDTNAAKAVGGGDGLGSGGGGAGFGGGIFVDGLTGVGVLNILNSFSTSSNSVAAGQSGAGGANNPGWAAGEDAFFMTGASITFDPNGGEIVFNNSIADDSPSSFVGIQPGTNPGTASGAIITFGNPASTPGTVYFPSSNQSTYGGATIVSTGRFRLDGSIASPVTVLSGALLQGVGTVHNSVLVDSGGRIHAGNSVGTITLGSLTLAGSGSILELDIEGNASSKYVVQGPVALNNGILQVNFLGGTVPAKNQIFDFIQFEGGDPGVFGTILASSPFTPKVIYAPNLISLQFVLNNNIIGEGIPLSGNERALAEYLNGLVDVAALDPIIIDLLSLSPDQLRAALDSISPARNAAATYFSNQSAFGVSRIPLIRLRDGRVLRHMKSHPQNKSLAAALETKHKELLALAESATPPSMEMIREEKESEIAANKFWPFGKAKTAAAKPENYSFWASGFGDFLHQDGQHSNPSIGDVAAGTLVGFDYYGYLNGIFNVATGYIHNDISEHHNAGSGTSNGAILSLYGTGYWGQGYFEGGALGNYNHFNMKRNVKFGGPFPFDETAKSSFNLWVFMPHLGGGYDWATDWGIIEPYASMDWAISFQPSYRETGASPLNMHIHGKSPSILRSELGVNFYETWDKEKYCVIFQQAASYINKAVFNSDMNAAIIIAPTPFPAGAHTTFNQVTYNKTLNLGSVSTEVFYKHKPSGVFLSGTYQGEFGSSFISNSIAGTIGVFW